MSDARKMAEEALAEIAAGDHGEYCGLRNEMLPAGGKTECYADCPKRVAKEALALLAAEPEGKACGSISAVRSDSPPAQPLPTCANCGSNLIAPAPAPDAVREAAERLVRKIDEVNNSPEYMAVWGLFWTHGYEYKGPKYEAELNALKAALWPEMAPLLAALDARPGGERGGE